MMRLPWIAGFVLVIVTATLLGTAGAPAQGADNETCLVCHRSPQESSKPGQKDPFYIHPELFARSVHGGFTCDTCHQGYTAGPHDPAAMKGVDESLLKIAGELQKKRGKGAIALASCVTCHYEIFQDYSQSVHGVALLEKGVKDAPYCLDCHGPPHTLMAKESPASRNFYTNIPATCASCHGNSEIILKYRLNTNVVPTYRDSFHGKKLILGSSDVAVCSSCHGAHKVVDPRSPAFMEGLANRCGQCHEGASPKFATAFAHIPATQTSEKIVHWAERFFAVLTGGVILGLVTHIGLDLASQVRIRRRRKNKKRK